MLEYESPSSRLNASSPADRAPYPKTAAGPATVPHFGFSPPIESSRSKELTAIVECAIIPRLMLAHARELGHDAPHGDRAGVMDAEVVDAFAKLALIADADQMLAFVAELMAAGRQLDEVYLDLLAPTARRLGTFWDEDLASYFDVTVALGRLQHLIHVLGWKIPRQKDPTQSSRTALFAPAPGEQHILGLIMAEDCFRRAGWRTWLGTDGGQDAAGRTLMQNRFDVVAFSLSNVSLTDRLADVIHQIRRTSRNREIFILVGGTAVQKAPYMLQILGADATATDGSQALTLAGEGLCHKA